MKKAYSYAGVSIFFWSTLATISKLMLGKMNSFQLLMLSSLFAAAALLAVNIFSGKIKLLKKYRIKDYALILSSCLPGTFLYYVFFYLGTEKISASQAFIINYLWPIMSVFFAFLLLREPLNLRKCIAFALSFLGVLTVAGGELFSFNPSSAIGMGLCVLAAISYGAFTALNQKFSYDEQISMMLSFFVTFILSTAISVFFGEPLSVGVLEILGSAWNGIFVMALATVTWALALKLGGTAKISNLAYITPFLSLIWIFLVIHEPISPFSVVGLIIIVLGIFIQLSGKKKSK